MNKILKILLFTFSLTLLILIGLSFQKYLLIGSPLIAFHIIVFITIFVWIILPKRGISIRAKLSLLTLILLPMMVAEIIIRAIILLNIYPSDQSSLKPLFPANAFQIPLYGEATLTADSISGYRWKQSGTAVLKIGDNKVEYFNQVVANQQGFCQAREYFGKKSPGTKRILVLGDSFTEACFLKHRWTENFESLLNSDNTDSEVYAFGINGGGIVNWHQLYFKEIVPNYSFDVIVLAIFGNDLSRDFISIHQKDQHQYIRYFPADSIQQSEADIQYAKPHKVIIGKRKLEKIKTLYSRGIHWYTPDLLSMNLLANGISDFVNYLCENKKSNPFLENYIINNRLTVDDNFLESKYGKEKMLMLEQIVQHAKMSGSQVVVSCIPEKKGAQLSNKGDTPQIARELSYLAEKHDVPYYNGYSAYSNLTDSIIESHFMSPDGHWNQKGSDFFSLQFHRAYTQLLD